MVHFEPERALTRWTEQLGKGVAKARATTTRQRSETQIVRVARPVAAGAAWATIGSEPLANDRRLDSGRWPLR